VARHNEIGAEGEMVAAEFLESKGLTIVDRNFRKPYGEIDIVAREKSGLIRFVEVKTVSWETVEGTKGRVPHETYRPEDNVHQAKLLRLGRVVETYLVSRGIEDDWEFDVLAVYLDQKSKTAKVRWLKDIVL
jgi:putative endonuclease